MADCHFTGARNLDQLRVRAGAFYLSPPQLPWERREMVAEEFAWRWARSRGWRVASWRPGWTGHSEPVRVAPWWPDWAGQVPLVVDPGEIVDLYRVLRKSREDVKDEPGAADYYYGEMEMRRHAHSHGGQPSRGRVDRAVLTAYWLVSGYGLRAWRAVAWLVGITLAFGLAFHLVGFTRPPQPASDWTSMLYALRSTISLTDDHVTLTAWGQLLQALLRLTGPVLLGLALLALRGRVKR